MTKKNVFASKYINIPAKEHYQLNCTSKKKSVLWFKIQYTKL